MKISFLGATGTVTGSKYLLEHDNRKILVDCGLFQGLKDLRLRNWLNLPINPAKIDAVILTHAHIDHSGYLPVLFMNGFRGKVYCSQGTYDLCEILLPDSGYIHEIDARRANKYNYSQHNPAKPLYTQEQATKSLAQFIPVDFGKEIGLAKEFSFSLNHSGHILGSAFVTIKFGKESLVFSGDLGRVADPVMNSPAILQKADYLVLESTYGDRLHEKTDPKEALAKMISTTISKGGTLLIPAFAVGRVQTLLYYIYKLKQEGRINNVPVYLDSPMAISATDILLKHKNEHQLSHDDCYQIGITAKYTSTESESKQIDVEKPSVIIAASGMATGGRVLRHLKNYLGAEKNTVLFTGFQAEGTRGERLCNGDKEVRIHGGIYQVNARVAMLEGLSAHADAGEIMEWLCAFKDGPKKVFITHGQPEASKALKGKIEKELNWNVCIPEYLSTETL